MGAANVGAIFEFADRRGHGGRLERPHSISGISFARSRSRSVLSHIFGYLFVYI